MINNIDSSGFNPVHLQPGAKRKSPLQKNDADKSGGLSEEELENLAGNLQQKTGVELNLSEAYSQYNADNNGELDDKELKEYLASQGLKPPAADSSETLLSNLESGITDTQLDSLVELLSEAMGADFSTQSQLEMFHTSETIDAETTLQETERPHTSRRTKNIKRYKAHE